jgi:uncharacterized protein YkwD
MIRVLGTFIAFLLLLSPLGAQDVSRLDSALLNDPALKQNLSAASWRVLSYCFEHQGEKVGNGECSTLVEKAFRVARAQRFPPFGIGADYVWGNLVATITPMNAVAGNVQPGDILQLHDTLFQIRNADGSIVTSGAPRHTAVVAQVTDNGRSITVLQQNAGGPNVTEEQKRRVQAAVYPLASLRNGWIKAYRPVPLPSATIAPVAVNDPSAIEIVQRLNRERAGNGINPLRPQGQVNGAARALAQRAALGQELQVTDVRLALQQAGYLDDACYFMTYRGAGRAADVASTWLNSEALRERLLSSAVTDVGIAVLRGQGPPLCFLVVTTTN